MPDAAALPPLVFAIGNPSRGDDALGPELARALQPLAATGACTLIEVFQLQPEDALELAARPAVLFVDAARPGGSASGAGSAAAGARGVALRRLRPAGTAGVFTHALEPAALLALAPRLGIEPPPAWVLALRGERFGLGEDLSAPARLRLAPALALARRWVAGHRALLPAGPLAGDRAACPAP